jgi:hypothetical protein
MKTTFLFALTVLLCQFAIKMDDPAFGRVPRARRGLGCAGVPGGTSSKNGPTGNEGIRLRANWHQGLYKNLNGDAKKPSTDSFDALDMEEKSHFENEKGFSV